MAAIVGTAGAFPDRAVAGRAVAGVSRRDTIGSAIQAPLKGDRRGLWSVVPAAKPPALATDPRVSMFRRLRSRQRVGRAGAGVGTDWLERCRTLDADASNLRCGSRATEAGGVATRAGVRV